ncbi:MAG: methyltransferase family protein [Candidatus Acidiferrales bacterium]
MQTNAVPVVAFYLVLLSWFCFAGIFTFRKKPPKAQKVKRAILSKWGIALQGVSYAAVWTLHRRPFTPLAPMPDWAEAVVAAVTVAIAIASVWLCLVSVRTLGKQWAYQARLIQGHELIEQGPYSVVRNPIYLGMFGLLVSTGMAYSLWQAAVGAAVIFLIGNQIRIYSEEKLLREAFGPAFDEYTGRVPAFIPRLF